MKRLATYLTAVALVAAACSDGDSTAPPSTDTTTPEATTTSIFRTAPQLPLNEGDGTFTVGTLFPLSGEDEALAPALTGAAQLAIDDINEAGGVLGIEAVLVKGDSGDNSTDTANQSVDQLITSGSDVIVGAVATDVSQRVIDKIITSNVIQFSPANSWPGFTDYDDDGLYFRTAPSDLLQAGVLADVVSGQGPRTVALTYQDTEYGETLANLFTQSYGELGGEVIEVLPYAPNTTDFGSIVDVMLRSGADAAVVIGLEESAVLIEQMHEVGIGPSAIPVYGVDGNTRSIGPLVSDPAILNGFVGIEPAVATGFLFEFTQQVDDRADTSGVYAYAPETYDAIIIAALATETAGTDEPSAVAAQIVDVTRGGVQCSTFAECLELAISGEDIDYQGLGGPYEFSDAGEPTAASFRVLTYTGGTEPDPTRDEFVLSR
ncbi:MAG: ABC transporter substrate-binding protein [Acidimicrobiia bacterium]|nr:ABC transporter substrate-binding protein [Acidimicrobiia bacterium]